MVHCPYLLKVASHCAGCQGWFCTSAGSKKKLSDPSMCKNEEEWSECPRYISKNQPSAVSSTPQKSESKQESTKPQLPTTPITVSKPRTTCPYLGPIPPNKTGCCGVWCYAKDFPLRSAKHCRSRPSWQECRFRLEADRKGVKTYTGS